MAVPPNLRLQDSPLPVLRDKLLAVDIRTNDYVRERGFIFEVNSAGTGQVVVYRTLHGTEDQKESLDAGQGITVEGVPVALTAIRSVANSDTTATSINIGIL